MKQLTFSNIVAVVAVLLCFYAFTEGKSSNAVNEKKEYCTLRYYSKGNVFTGLYVMYSNGKYETFDIVKEDHTGLKQIQAKTVELLREGWEMKTNSITTITAGGTPVVDQYIFERSE